ncbi:ComEA family DNA-binding protein [Nonomuraea sp. MCN248]|uniref:ComEA family DNA-binding protein n=1 Tax=Nonomuraea corallina TaxID=2989783 RepID=A0ABT4SCT1_9ACTN|nr:ComEA family DNA-binding protein [Nonomuraea corallina]MDA0634945.1 ComEA family DNA-binding protein [Nonomuraea corallina]
MRAQDSTSERTIAESRIRSLTGSEPASFLAGVPESFQAFRASAGSLDPGRPGLRALLALGAVAVLVAGFFLWRSRPVPEPLPAPTPVSGPVSSSMSGSGHDPAPSAAVTTKVTVHVAGKVHEPGVYPLPTGSRVQDAITAAGGVRRGASLDTLNLARRLVDGEQIMVGLPAAAPGPAGAPDAAVLDLNAATQDQLEQLPGVGEVLASRIIDFRTTHGGFTSVDQLRDVSGIGTRRFDEIKPKVRV